MVWQCFFRTKDFYDSSRRAGRRTGRQASRRAGRWACGHTSSSMDVPNEMQVTTSSSEPAHIKIMQKNVHRKHKDEKQQAAIAVKYIFQMVLIAKRCHQMKALPQIYHWREIPLNVEVVRAVETHICHFLWHIDILFKITLFPHKFPLFPPPFMLQKLIRFSSVYDKISAPAGGAEYFFHLLPLGVISPACY